MNTMNPDVNVQVIRQAINFGASVAGIASVEALQRSPSHFIIEKLAPFESVSTNDSDKPASGQLVWPENFESAVVIGVGHPEDKPELDWWRYGYKGGTSGNNLLIGINARLSEWLETEKGYRTRKLSYYVENGGIFLKDAAVMAGLGCIGKNNLFINPDFGPRIRLRAILIDAVLPAAGAIEFNPCEPCDMPCRTACPRAAFQNKLYHGTAFGLDELPGRSGVYSRQLCNLQLEEDIRNCEMIEVDDHTGPAKLVKYCRRCEFACPVGHHPID